MDCDGRNFELGRRSVGLFGEVLDEVDFLGFLLFDFVVLMGSDWEMVVFLMFLVPVGLFEILISVARN